MQTLEILQVIIPGSQQIHFREEDARLIRFVMNMQSQFLKMDLSCRVTEF